MIASRQLYSVFPIIGFLFLVGCSSLPTANTSKTTDSEVAVTSPVPLPDEYKPIPSSPVQRTDKDLSVSSITPRRYVSNKEIWQILGETDGVRAHAKTIQLFYTRRIQPWSQRASGSLQGNTDYWNREHIWPQSKGLKGNPSRMDLYNIVPADSSVNSSRSNKYFDYAECAHEECTGCRADAESWEPPDEVKGDVARMAFYMDAVYNEASTINIQDLSLVATLPSQRREDFGRLDSLLLWHCSDPVSSYERNRNAIIERYQGNRNLFVDRPELIEQQYAIQCENLLPLHEAKKRSGGSCKLENDNRTSNERYSDRERLFCDNLTSLEAMRAYLDGHTYLDGDGDGKPCEWQQPVQSKPSTRSYSPTKPRCTQVRGYYRKDGTYVRPHQRCR